MTTLETLSVGAPAVRETSPYRAVGVYIFAGGFTRGIVDAGFHVNTHLEAGSYGVATSKANFPGLRVWRNPATWPRSEFRGIDLVYGNPPCAAWSVAGASLRRGKTQWMTDERVDCTRNLFSMLRDCDPKVWMWESVTQAYTRGRELVQALSDEAVSRGYLVTHLFTSALLHGIPQPRRRFLMVASKVEIDFDKPVALKPTVGATLGLSRSDAEGSIEGWTQTCPVWGLPRTTPRETRMMALTLPGEDVGEGWKRWHEIDPEAAGQWPALFVNRLSPDGLGGTQTSQVMHVHPVWARYVADSECARLSSYPDDYVWVPDRYGNCRAMIAQAVLPGVGRYLGSRVRRALDANVKCTPRIRLVSHLEKWSNP